MFTVKICCQKGRWPVPHYYFIEVVTSETSDKITWGIFKVQMKILPSSLAGMDISISFNWRSRVNAIFLLICAKSILLCSTTDTISCGRSTFLLSWDYVSAFNIADHAWDGNLGTGCCGIELSPHWKEPCL